MNCVNRRTTISLFLPFCSKSTMMGVGEGGGSVFFAMKEVYELLMFSRELPMTRESFVGVFSCLYRFW